MLRPALVAQGKLKVAQGRFFTLFAPRQAGKTTTVQLLLAELKAEAQYLPLCLSFEGLKTLSRSRFYEALSYRLQQELTPLGLSLERTMVDQFDLEQAIGKIFGQARPVVLVIDEFEEVPAEVLSELLYTFRAMYHRRAASGLQALILIGVSTVAELVVSSASPFNVVDELALPYFTPVEVEELIGQYVTESGQPFAPAVVAAVYYNTQGQPGLVTGLAAYLVEKAVPDRTMPVTIEDFYRTLQHFLTERFDKNILNIIEKARNKKDFMLDLLFTTKEFPFSLYDPDIAYLYAHGVIHNIEDYVGIGVPLYSKALITAFRPLFNGEAEHYLSRHDTFSDYTIGDRLNMAAILNKYQEYVRRRGFKAFDTEQLREAAWHYSLDGFINFFISALGGQTFIEVPTGRGRTDILILYKNQKYIIETKIYTHDAYFQRGKVQLAHYLALEGLAEGYYVVFSRRHTEEDKPYSEEEIEGKKICTYLIRVNLAPAGEATSPTPPHPATPTSS